MIHIYMGTSSLKFKSLNPTVPVIRVTNRDEIEEFYVGYSGISMDTPIALEDISYLSSSNQSFLLKFLEETTLNIALLARFDSILPTIVSRADRVFKRLPQIKFSRVPMEDTLDHFHRANSVNEKWKIVSEENPKVWYLLHKYPNMKDKYFQFFT